MAAALTNHVIELLTGKPGISAYVDFQLCKQSQLVKKCQLSKLASVTNRPKILSPALITHLLLMA